MTYAIMDDAVIPYTLREAKDHSFFFISQHGAPSIEAKMTGTMHGNFISLPTATVCA